MRDRLKRAALYVHIPFCSSRCDYCDFYSESGISPDIHPLYVDRLLDQLKREQDRYGIDGFTTVYIGGGTPSLLAPEALKRLLDGINSASRKKPEEWTVEANPESLTHGQIALLQGCGVERISLGIQSSAEPVRRYLGRRGSKDTVSKAFTLLEESWPGRISVDLIRGVPAAISHSLEAELKALPLGMIDHLSLYDLTLTEDTPLASRAAGPEEGELYEDDLTILPEFGFARYEVSNFARPGAVSRHNIAYWEIDPYLALGAGGVGLIPGEEGSEGFWRRIINEPDLQLYLNGDYPDYQRAEQPTRVEFLMEHLIMGLRQVRGVCLARILDRFGENLEALIPHAWSEWLGVGDAELSKGRLRLTEKSFEFQNRLLLAAWSELDRRNPFA